jgi:cyclic beta-1,2-glucan synthetase
VSVLQLLSNGRYRVLLSGQGGGGSFLGNIALTRWTQDGTRDAEGYFLYIRDLDSGALWSAGHQPVRCTASRYQTRSGPGCAEIIREDAGVESRLEIAVDPDHDLEIRRLTLINRSAQRRRLSVTSYAEVCLNLPAADAGHPAFSKLFIQTEYHAATQALLARRRPRSPEEPWHWMGHGLWVTGARRNGAPEYETDRARFLGRGRSTTNPAALQARGMLSGTIGNVLDPVFAVQRTVTLPPGEDVTLVALLAGGLEREALLHLLTAREAEQAPQRLAAAHLSARVTIETIGITPAWRQRLPWLTSAIHHGGMTPRFGIELPDRSPLQPGDLRGLGLTGSLPLVVAAVDRPDQARELEQLAGVVRWWRESGVDVDLLVLRGEGMSVSGIGELAHGAGGSRTVIQESGSLSREQRELLERTARLTLAQALGHRPVPAAATPVVYHPADPTTAAASRGLSQEPLQLFNGTGGFSRDGREYVIRMPGVKAQLPLPPLPWTNVIANEEIGFIASERGLSHAWSANSRENRLTPWSNDPVCDPPSEAIFLRCEASQTYWSPTPAPAQGCGDYEVRHGFGYSTWTHVDDGLRQELTAFVPRGESVKLLRLRIMNEGTSVRRLSVFSYAELLLGILQRESSRLVTTHHDPESGAILAANPHRGEFAGRIAFAALLGPDGAVAPEWTADRREFLGAGGSLQAPQGVRSGRALQRRAGAGLDPCAAFRLELTLPAHATAECVVLLGETEGREPALRLLQRYRRPELVQRDLDDATAFWQELVSRVQVRTPDPALDLMLNGWLTYQNLSCRVWGRTAFYQSGGAFGFRDQLQDAAALLHLDPALTRRQILLHAAHQFVEGDVLHWWHPPLDKGIRTRFSDDLLWLPLFTAEYTRHTGDLAILDEPVPFVTARQLEPGEDEAFVYPTSASAGQPSADLYDHCCRALDRSLTRGVHGLPLMGTGDWNDGMNRVGREGRGESVWLGFFLYQILDDFLPLVDRRGDERRAERYRAYREELRVALNRGGWDGGWYRRAYYDHGGVIGSKESDECRIDVIAQAWAVLSGAAPEARAAQALTAMERYLVDEEIGIIRLLTPAFDVTPNDPGYIKGYLPGVRENGGQYTHGALWAIRALAQAGRRDRAASLLAMLSPVSHTRSAAQVVVYQAEPYVIAADVYGVAPHNGRGGWTWYTGSAGWMFRVGLESILGVTTHGGNELQLRPCLPSYWPEAAITYRIPGSHAVYHISYTQPRKLPETTTAHLDGSALEIRDGAVIVPIAKSGNHQVTVTVGQDIVPRYRPR